MKKIVFVFAGIFLCSISFGQTQFGFKAGANMANVSMGENSNNKARLGFNAGALLRSNLNKNFLLQPELQYSVKGYRSLATQSSSEATVTLNYVAVPILLGYKPFEELTILFGPELGFLTNAKSKFDGTSRDLTSTYNKIDLGIDLGLAYKVSRNAGIDLRYNYGFKGLINATFTDQYGSVISSGKIGANKVLQLGVFYLLSN